MNLNTTSAFNLANILANYRNRSHQQNNSLQQPYPQNIQQISIPPSPQTQYQYQSNLHNIKCETLFQPIQNANTITNLPSPSLTNQYIQLLSQLNYVATTQSATTNQNYNHSNITKQNDNTNNILPNPLKLTNNMTCNSVKLCQSIRRIVKLGVFQRKFGPSNQNKIIQFINNCTQYQSLNYDYQHSLIFHLSSNDKLQIASLSKEYDIIFDVIHNLQTVHHNHNNNNISLQELIFYNNTMDQIYNGIDIKSVIADTQTNLQLTVPISVNTNMPIIPTISPTFDSMDDSSSSHSSNTTPTNASVQTKQSFVVQNVHTNANEPLFSTLQSAFNSNENVQNINITSIKQPIVTPPSYNNKNYNKILLSKNNPFSTKATDNYVQVQQKFSKVKYIAPSNNKNTPMRRFKCDDCGKSYKHLCNLRSHQKIHTDAALICSHCGKRFGRKANYKEHLRIHTGETPYQCKFCKRKFKHHHSWKDHMRIHTGEKPYECNICKKKFKVGHNLTVHMRIHTGEKPYTCVVCSKQFRQKSALNSHLKRVHY